MKEDNKIKIFEDKKIRTAWNESEEEWYFSVVDVVAVLTNNDYDGARDYWKVLKKRLKDEGADQLVTNCNQLKLVSPKDGKMYSTDILSTNGILRLIQSIPSKKTKLDIEKRTGKKVISKSNAKIKAKLTEN